MRRLFSLLSIALAAVFPANAAAPANMPVDLELVLAVDVSRSVDSDEARLQREGYIRAFRDPQVVRAITHGLLGRIALAYFEWADASEGGVVVDWTLIDGETAATAVADALEAGPRRNAMRTSISRAIRFALPWFDGNGFDGTRRVVDISGDGPNNWGGLVTAARDEAVAAGLTVNGLPILGSGGIFSWYDIPDLDLYYRDCVIGGPGAFLVVAEDFGDFARAVRRKLILEIAGRRPPEPPRLVPAQAPGPGRVSPPCDIGEQLLRNREGFD